MRATNSPTIGGAPGHMPAAPFQVLFHVPPQAGGMAVLGAEGQERRPEFLIACCHCDSFPATPGLSCRRQ
jgi:hypothetical protein